MSIYNQEFNKDNTILRYITVALLAELEDKVYYYNQIDEDTLKKVNVPFYYSVTGNSRFLLDNFLYDAQADGKAIGDYEVVPRGVIQLNSISIDSGNQTNKFVRSEFVREVDGILKTFSMETAFLPISMTYNVTVICSNNLEMFKATESIINKLYKVTMFSVDLGMFRIEASLGVPEDYSQERSFEFALNDKKEFNVTFSIEVKSFIPVFEKGILLSEINELTRLAVLSNPNAEGVGMLRSNARGELGIYFGGIFQKIEFNSDNIAKVTSESMLSNEEYVNPSSIRRGGPYSEADIDTSVKEEESEESKKYRNADDDS